MRIMSVACLAASLAAASLFASPAEAGRRTIVGDYFFEQTTIFCPNSGLCSAVSDQLPADRFLNVTQVSCGIELFTEPPFIFLAARDVAQGADNRSINLSFTSKFLRNNKFYISFNQLVDFKIGKGKYAAVTVDTLDTTPIDASCSVSGRLSTD